MSTRSKVSRSSSRRSGSDGIDQLTSVDGTVVFNPTNGEGAVVDLSVSGSGASWPIANARVYAVDGALGNDTNKGFADAASSSAADYRAACVAAGAVAKKTLAGLAAIFPKVGNGRMVVILIAAGTYVAMDPVLNGVEGYVSGCPLVRGTVTNATATSVQFTGTAADEVMSGGVTATGMNAAGYNATGGTAAQLICQLNGGGAPGFAAEPAIPLGFRVRFDSNTATVALRNQCRQVALVFTGNTLNLQTALPAVPAPADVFYLEMPGVVINAFNFAGPPNGQLGVQFSGIRSSGAWGIQFADAHFAFCSGASIVGQLQTWNEVVFSQSFTNPVLGAITPGGGFRSEAAASFSGGGEVIAAGLVTVTDTTFSTLEGLSWGSGCAARDVIVVSSRLSQALDTAASPNLGNLDGAGIGIPHTFGTDGSNGAIQIDGSDVTLAQINVVNAAGTPCLQVRGKSNVLFTGVVAGNIGGLTGNTDVGMDLQQSNGSTIQITAGKLPTITGITFGDVRWSGPSFDTWTSFNLQEQYDGAGNRIAVVTNNAEYDWSITPSVSLQVNNSGGVANRYNLVTHAGASGQFRPSVTSDSPMGVLGAQTSNGAAGLVGALEGYRVVAFDSAPALGGLVFISATPGLATTTNPGTGTQVPLGIVTFNAFAGNLGVVHFGSVSTQGNFAASWAVGNARVYALDGTNGNDTNLGYADPASSSQADFQAASVAAGAVAKKTLAGLGAIFPRQGNGRQVVVLIATGTYVGGLDTFLAGSTGYVNGYPLVRGTVTNATAGSVAFASSDADRIMVGAVTATGMNAAGYNPTGAATTTSLPCTKVGGAAPGFTAGGLDVPIGWRIRFDSNTATVALRNQCVGVSEISTVTTLIPTLPFNAVPAIGDVFYLEMAGVNVGATVLDGANVAGPTAFQPFGNQIVGILFATLNVNGGMVSTVLCGCSGLSVGQDNGGSLPAALQTIYLYIDPFNFFTTGGGLRNIGDAFLGNANYGLLFSLVVTGNLEYNSALTLSFMDGCAAKLLLVGNSFCGTATASVALVGTPALGTNFPTVQVPIVRGGAGTNGVNIVGSSVQIQAMNLQSCGASPCLRVRGASVIVISGVVAGSTGNTDVGLDLTTGVGALIVLSATPTVTGTAGDVRLAGGQIITWAQALTGIVDSKGNKIVGTGASGGNLKFSGTVLGGAGAVLAYLSDAGTGLAANVINRPGYPSSLRLYTKLKVTSVSNTAANAVTVTLYKNGVATAMTVSIPAASAAYTVFTDSAHPILFAEGDTLDLRLDDAADVGAIVNVSAMLFYPD